MRLIKSQNAGALSGFPRRQAQSAFCSFSQLSDCLRQARTLADALRSNQADHPIHVVRQPARPCIPKSGENRIRGVAAFAAKAAVVVFATAITATRRSTR